MQRLFIVFYFALILSSTVSAYTIVSTPLLPEKADKAGSQFCIQANTFSLVGSDILKIKKDYPAKIYSDGTRWTYLLTVDYDEKAVSATPLPATVSCLVANFLNQCAQIVVTYNTYIQNDIAYFNYPNKVQFFSLPATTCLSSNLLK